jgi:nitrogen-specific signal transduction histidine kinase
MFIETQLGVLYGGVYAGTAVLTAVLCWWTLTRTEMRSRRSFGALMGVLSAWALLSAGGLFVTSQSVHELLAVVQEAAGLLTVLAWVVFTVDYTGGDPLVNRRVQLFVVAHVGLLAAAVTMPFYDLYYASMLFRNEPFAHFETTVGVGRAAALLYAVAGASLGTYYLLQLFVNTRYQSRTQTLLLTGGIALGLVPAGVSLFEATPVPTYDHTAFGISAFVIVVTYAVFRHSFAKLVPIARDVAVAEIKDPLLIVDRDGRLVDYNDTASRVVPALDGGSVGAGVSTLVPELDSVYTADHPKEVTLPVDGETRHYSVRVSQVEDQRSTRGHVILLRDITERTEREQELEAARQELEASNERLEEFASVVSHDLRSPLNVAQLGLELAREDRDDEQLATVAQAHDRMERLIDDLLDLARQGAELDDVEQVSVTEFAHNCWHTVETADATLVVETDQTVRADPDRLRQLLENLFRNAVDHGPADVTVTVGALSSGFYVADDGPGIPENERDRVLERGYSTASEGTGLGLSLVETAAAAHGWEMVVTESEEDGARFEFTGADVTRVSASQD